MTIENKVGLEAEFLLKNAKGELIIPPESWDRDGFPLLGEIRGEAGETPAETVTNFISKKMELMGKLRKGHRMVFAGREQVPLKLYKKANAQIDYAQKEQDLGVVQNIYDIDISEFSDQIVAKNRIQGMYISCGLHIHFSCREVDEVEVKRQKYERVEFPIAVDFTMPNGEVMENNGKIQAVKQMLKPYIYLYRDAGYELEETLYASASRLNKPAIRFIIDELDKAFFDRFAPDEKERTKYRQPGFYELKPYGFEYRSLPFTDEVESCLFEIAEMAFGVLGDVNSE